jgi:hypothetical protein
LTLQIESVPTKKHLQPTAVPRQRWRIAQELSRSARGEEIPNTSDLKCHHSSN